MWFPRMTASGVATVGGEVVRKDMDEELAYRLTKAVLNNLDAIKSRPRSCRRCRSASYRHSHHRRVRRDASEIPPWCGPRGKRQVYRS